jgi:hypothetical protein
MAGMSIGIVCGMKYTAFFLTIPLQLIILLKAISGKRSHALWYLTLIVTLSGWWYLRNAYIFGNPFYPMNLLVSGMGFMGGSGESSAFKDILQNVRNWLLMFPLEDIGIGSYDGGFGLIFWGLGFPSWLVVFAHSITHLKKNDAAKYLVLMQMPIGLLLLMLIPINQMPFAGRLSLFVVAVGLLSLTVVFGLLKNNHIVNVIKSVCVLSSLLTVCLMSISSMPSYRIDSMKSSGETDSLPAEYRFPMNTNTIYEVLKNIWYPLDYLTRDDMPGINCYISSNYEYFTLAPYYGSMLQNRPITIGSDVPPQLDAFVFLHFPPKDLFGNVIRQKLLYPNTIFSQEQVLSQPENVVITQTEFGCLIMKKKYLFNPEKVKRLRIYYGETWPDTVAAAEKLLPFLHTGVPVVTAHNLAYGLLYHELGTGAEDRVVLVPAGYEESVVKWRKIARCYTLEHPLKGYASEEIAAVPLNQKSVRIYLNYDKK